MASLSGDLRITGVVSASDYLGLREEKTITGDGATRAFTLCHTLGVRFVWPLLYDSAGRVVRAAYQCRDESHLCIRFFHAPAQGETFTAVIRR